MRLGERSRPAEEAEKRRQVAQAAKMLEDPNPAAQQRGETLLYSLLGKDWEKTFTRYLRR